MSRSGKDWIKTYLEYTARTEPPTMYKEWVAVSTVAAVLKRKVWLDWGINTRIYPNMYVVLVGPPGRCRKGTAMISGENLLKEIGIKIAAKSITREALIGELDATSDLLATPGQPYISHASLNIWSPELTVFLGYDNKQLLMDLTDLYDCADNWEYVTKTSGSNEISGVWLNLLGATTPKLIQSTLPLDAVGGGLASRMIFVYEDSRGKQPQPFVTDREKKLKDILLDELGDIHTYYGDFSFTPEAMTEWITWYTHMSNNPPNMPPEFEGYINRRQTHARKIAMIMSASRGGDMSITKADWDRAVNLMERTEVKMPRVFAGVGSSRHASIYVTLMEYINKKGRVTLSEIYQDMYGSIESPRQLRDMLDMLRSQKFCKLEQVGSEVEVVYLKGHKLDKMFGGGQTP